MDAKQYAAAAKRHLQRNDPERYRKLEQAGRLDPEMNDLGEEAARQEELIERQFLERNPVPANAEYLERAAHLAQAEQVAQEMVMADLILTPDKLTAQAIRQGGYRD